MKSYLILMPIYLVFLFGINPNDPIPFDAAVTTGTLENGLTYYIKENQKPENRAELRLAINIGSIDEDDDQQGIAHLVEHMCFNGTEKYPKSALVDYLESIGMAFGPDLNAFTSFDKTVYMLQIPTDDSLKFESGVEILSEWAGFVTFEDEEIDKERGVVIEEWRRGRGADARIRDEQFPILFHGSKYAERLPIGKVEVVENTPGDRIRDFYNKWYQPHLMAVIAVGDFESSQVVAMIEKYFGRIKASENIEIPDYYPVPDHDEILSIASSDPEATRTSATIAYKMEVEKDSLVSDFTELIQRALIFDMFNQRMDEIVQQPDPPFAFSFIYNRSFVESKAFTFVSVFTKNNLLYPGLERAHIEIERINRFGFTEGELSRAKARYMSRKETSYNERDKTESKKLVWEYVSHFLSGDPSPGIEWEYSTSNELILDISINDINTLTSKFLPEENVVIESVSPVGENIVLPTSDSLIIVYENKPSDAVQPYIDIVIDKPLLSVVPEPGQIVKEEKLEEISLTQWTLSNGAHVSCKKTDFKNDEILIRAFAEGGNSTTLKNDYSSGDYAAKIVLESGIGGFTPTELDKLLAGKNIRMTPYIQAYYHGINGKSTPRDLETAMQLLYLYFTAPNEDPVQYQVFLDRFKVYIMNRKNSPESNWYDLVKKINYSDNYSRQPLELETLDKIDHAKALNIYRYSFGNPANFNFQIIGNFEWDVMKVFVETYIGGLPAIHSEQTVFGDYNLKFPIFPKKSELKMGSEEKSRTRITFYKPIPKDFDEQYYLYAANELLKVRLRKLLREEMSATYHVSINSSNFQPSSVFNTAKITFNSAPENVDKMVKSVFSEIKKLKKTGPTEDEVQNIIAKHLNGRETSLKTNNYWISRLQGCLKNNVDPTDISTRDERINSLSAMNVQQSIKKYYPKFRHTIITLNPENDQN